MPINARKIILSEAAAILRHAGQLDLAAKIEEVELPKVDGGPGIRILTFEKGKIVDASVPWFSLPLSRGEIQPGQTVEAVIPIRTNNVVSTQQVTSVSIEYAGRP